MEIEDRWKALSESWLRMLAEWYLHGYSVMSQTEELQPLVAVGQPPACMTRMWNSGPGSETTCDYTGNRQSRSFFKEMSIFSCVEAFPGSRAFLQNASKLWWSQRNHVFKCFCVFSCVQLGFRYLVMLWVYVVFVAFSWGETFFVAAAFLSVTSVRSTVFSNYC